MRNLLLIIATGFFTIWLGRLGLGMIQGRVKGAHPIERKLTWIAKSDHPGHFWAFTLLQIVLLVILAWLIVGIWNTPAL